MEVETTKLAGVLLVTPKLFSDERGWFFESYNSARYADVGITGPFVQDNVSSSSFGVLRGLHYQAPPAAQGKLVQVLRGRALDVAVDIRKGSPTYGEYISVEISEDNKKQVWIPRGFAHGFLSLEEGTILSYKCDAPYSPEYDRGIAYNDPDIGIDWGVLGEPILSEKDAQHPRLSEIDTGFAVGGEAG